MKKAFNQVSNNQRFKMSAFNSVFNTAVMYKFMCEGKDDGFVMYFVEYDVELEDELDGYRAYECYDELERKFIYYMHEEYDAFDFSDGHHFLKLWESGETFTVLDICELADRPSPYTPRCVAASTTKYEFDYYYDYRFLLKNGDEIKVTFMSEEENRIHESEKMEGYTAYRCVEYDSDDDSWYVFYVKDNYDLYDVKHHILKKCGDQDSDVFSEQVFEIVAMSQFDDEEEEDDAEDAEPEPYPFDYFVTYEFTLSNGEVIDLYIQRENENDVSNKEQMDGYSAYECYDRFENRYVYFVNQEYDLFDFGDDAAQRPHILKRYDAHLEKFTYEFGVVDILEL